MSYFPSLPEKKEQKKERKWYNTSGEKCNRRSYGSWTFMPFFAIFPFLSYKLDDGSLFFLTHSLDMKIMFSVENVHVKFDHLSEMKTLQGGDSFFYFDKWFFLIVKQNSIKFWKFITQTEWMKQFWHALMFRHLGFLIVLRYLFEVLLRMPLLKKAEKFTEMAEFLSFLNFNQFTLKCFNFHLKM